MALFDSAIFDSLMFDTGAVDVVGDTNPVPGEAISDPTPTSAILTEDGAPALAAIVND